MRWLLLFLFGVSLLPFVYSQGANPISVQTTDPSDNTLTIIYPKQEFFPSYSTFKLHFHVYNSTAVPLYPSELNCIIHIYNKTNNHVVDARLNKTGDERDVFYEITSDTYIAQNKGLYPYLVSCNSTAKSNQYGYISSYFIVADDGFGTENNTSLLPFSLMLLVVFGVYFYVAKTWDIALFSKNKNSETSVVKIFLLTAGIWLLPLLVRIMQIYTYGNTRILMDTMYFWVVTANIVVSFVLGIFAFYNIVLYLSKVVGGK